MLVGGPIIQLIVSIKLTSFIFSHLIANRVETAATLILFFHFPAFYLKKINIYVIIPFISNATFIYFVIRRLYIFFLLTTELWKLIKCFQFCTSANLRKYKNSKLLILFDATMKFEGRKLQVYQTFLKNYFYSDKRLKLIVFS